MAWRAALRRIILERAFVNFVAVRTDLYKYTNKVSPLRDCALTLWNTS